MYVCLCKAINEQQMRSEVSSGCGSLGEMKRRNGIGSQCGCCRKSAREMIRQLQQSNQPYSHHLTTACGRV